jgi:hypothetical protein
MEINYALYSCYNITLNQTPKVTAMGRKRVTVTKESKSGRNETFHDNYTNEDMSRAKFVKKINQGDYPNYHIRNINGIKTPVSDPDSSVNNNLD